MVQVENSFLKLGLNALLVKSLNNMGYVTPSPIQKLCIPYLLSGNDVLGMAQTGSGKTAAFALPLLHNIILGLKYPQVLVLTPTRELAIQVSKAFMEFAKYIVSIKVVPLYGGQRYDIQLRELRRGPQIIVGTPGRLLDHLNRGTLNLSQLKGLVLDEADEMLRMGFIEDVENILRKIPSIHQTALFSATMPEVIRIIAKKFMVSPKEVKIQSNIITRPNIKQFYWMVYGRKTDGLIRFLESEEFSATIIFVRTKYATLEVAEALDRHGYNSAALNGDMNQHIREKTLDRLKDGRLDILIATDVAARGLDVDRVSLVINYDIPMDVESYIHRIGRTGRAGRIGKALLFVERREYRLFKNIENTLKQPIIRIELPNMKLLSECRLKKLSQNVLKECNSVDLEKYCSLLPKLNPDNKFTIETLAAALLKIAQGKRPLIISDVVSSQKKFFIKHDNKKKLYTNIKTNTLSFNSQNKFPATFKKSKSTFAMNLYRIEVGYSHGVEVRHIVGAIANEGKINSCYIGSVKIFSEFSTIELSRCLPKSILSSFINTRILNKLIKIKLYNYGYKLINKKRSNFYSSKYTKK
ncbi:ATP-dependent RNA helicase DeaD [Buchnera aphidicola (Pterocallis alni)]|uniref:DEAD/DEAH box helicase n=1 Tax=Buchnera aphidicola TaxID=9 RepID=UPI00346429C6